MSDHDKIEEAATAAPPSPPEQPASPPKRNRRLIVVAGATFYAVSLACSFGGGIMFAFDRELTVTTADAGALKVSGGDLARFRALQGSELMTLSEKQLSVMSQIARYSKMKDETFSVWPCLKGPAGYAPFNRTLATCTVVFGPFGK